MANVWLSLHTLVIILTLTTTHFFKTSFESSRACRVTQASLQYLQYFLYETLIVLSGLLLQILTFR